MPLAPRCRGTCGRFFKRDRDVVHFQHGDVRGRRPCPCLSSGADGEVASTCPLTIFGDHPGEFFLDEFGERSMSVLANCLRVLGVLQARGVVAGQGLAEIQPQPMP